MNDLMMQLKVLEKCNEAKWKSIERNKDRMTY